MGGTDGLGLSWEVGAHSGKALAPGRDATTAPRAEPQL